MDLVFTGGEGGIRTHGTDNRTLDFESSPFDHSGTSPFYFFVKLVRIVNISYRNTEL